MIIPMKTRSEKGRRKSHLANALDRNAHGNEAPKNQNTGRVTVAMKSVIVRRLDSDPGASNIMKDIRARPDAASPIATQITDKIIQSVLSMF
jgi:hypothetical protein